MKRAMVVMALVAAVAPVRADDAAVRAKVVAMNDVTGEDAIKGKILELLKDKDKPAVKTQIATAAKIVGEDGQPLNYAATFIHARAAHGLKAYPDAETLYKACFKTALKLKSGRKLAEVLDGMSMLFGETKKYDDALQVCQELLDLDAGPTVEKNKPFVLERMVEILTKQEKYDKAIELADKLVDADKGGFYFVSLKAGVLRDQGKFDEALKLYDEAIENVGKMDKLTDALRKQYERNLRYITSSVYTDMNQVDKAVDVLRKLIAENPDRATFYNDLGYIMADHDKNLDEAETLVRKALDLEKAAQAKAKADDEDDDAEPAGDGKPSSAYLDSLAWAQFKKKQYADAKKIMLDVVKDESAQHVEIYDHLAEIHWALGEKAEAIAAWEKGLSLDNVSKRDVARKDAVKKKLAERKKD